METEMETNAINWKRDRNEGGILEIKWKALLTSDGNEGPRKTPLRFHAVSLVSILNTPRSGDGNEANNRALIAHTFAGFRQTSPAGSRDLKTKIGA